jgi:hypothetical protein
MLLESAPRSWFLFYIEDPAQPISAVMAGFRYVGIVFRDSRLEVFERCSWILLSAEQADRG